MRRIGDDLYDKPRSYGIPRKIDEGLRYSGEVRLIEASKVMGLIVQL